MDASSIQIGPQGNAAEFLAAVAPENAASPETSFPSALELVRALQQKLSRPLQSAPADANQEAKEAETSNPGDPAKHSVGNLVGFAAHLGALRIAEGERRAHVTGVAAATDVVPPAPLATDFNISGDSLGTAGQAMKDIHATSDTVTHTVLEDRGDKTGKVNESEMASVLDRVDHATRRHLSTLEGALSKVPNQARLAIEHALRASMKGNESATSALSRTPAVADQAGFSSPAGPAGRQFLVKPSATGY